MTKHRQRWTPDTLFSVTFEQEWDDADRDADPVCVRIIDRAAGTEIVDPVECAARHAKALGNNRFKNLEIVPALLAALPAEEKMPTRDEKGEITGETFVSAPEWETDKEGEIRIKQWRTVRPESRAAGDQVVVSKRAEKIERERGGRG